MLPAITLLLTLTATFRPAQPAVGDPVVIDFPAPVTLDPSPQYEVISQRGNQAIVRTFEARPFPLSGRAGEVSFRNLIVPVQSVLKSKEDLEPSPLVPPRAVSYPPIAKRLLIAFGCVTVLVWAMVFALARRKSAAAVSGQPQLPPAERYRQSVIALRDHPDTTKRWAALADATRQFLPAIDHALGVDLTTTEMLRRIQLSPLLGDRWPAHGEATLSEILRQGDLEKFAPWGARASDFAVVATRALELAPEPTHEEVAA